MGRFKGVISSVVAMLFMLTSVFGASAQSVDVLGDIKGSGEVFIASANGSWLPVKNTYPLIENTNIKTGCGTASLYFKDSSRADIGKESLASVAGSASDFSITLSTGTISFNMTGTAKLSIVTPSATVSVTAKNNPVQKVDLSGERVIGAVAVTEKGTEVRSISGRIMVGVPAGESRVVPTGESIFIGTDSSVRVYKTQAVANDDDDDTCKKAGAYWLSGDKAIEYGILGVVGVTSGTAFALGSHWNGNGEGRLASPSGFSAPAKK